MKTLPLLVLSLVLHQSLGWASQGEPIPSPKMIATRRHGGSSAGSARRILTPDFDSARWKQAAKLFDAKKASISAIFRGATKVESFRLFSSSGEAPIGELWGCPYFAKGKTMDRAFAGRLGHIVLSPKTYYVPGQDGKMCWFDPGVALRVWKGPKFVDTFICFHCNQLKFVGKNLFSPEEPNADFKRPALATSAEAGDSIAGGRTNLAAKEYLAGDFDSLRPQLLAVVKAAFPNDKSIQSLTDFH